MAGRNAEQGPPILPICLSCADDPDRTEGFVNKPGQETEQGFFLSLTHLSPYTAETVILKHMQWCHPSGTAQYLISYGRQNPEDPIRFQMLDIYKDEWAYGEIEEIPAWRLHQTIQGDPNLEKLDIEALLTMMENQTIAFDLAAARRQYLEEATPEEMNVLLFFLAQEGYLSCERTPFEKKRRNKRNHQNNPPDLPSNANRSIYFPRRNLSKR